MKKAYCSLLLGSLFLSLQGQSQDSLSGTVTRTADNLPLEQVEIYFPQLEKGSLTNKQGHYTVNDLPLGAYKLVIAYLGFQTQSQTIVIEKGTNTFNVALSPSAIEMEEVIVSSPFHKLQRENVVKVDYANVSLLKKKGAVTLSDGITNIPGVESVSTGLGIGKPVIRGLSSNRVLVYAQGIRLENQQFGDEHGLGTSAAGIESVEVIKGPASLLYGSDAMGGVLYLNPEKFATAKTTEGDLDLNYFSNTQGYSTNLGLRTSGEKFKFLVRGGTSSHIDYSTGNGQKVTNSRFREHDLKTGLAYQTTNFKTALRYTYNTTDIGIPEEIADQTTQRTPELPYQKINTHLLSSKTQIFFDRSSLELTLGYTYNDRREFEDSKETATLDMDLGTFNYTLHYHLPKWGKMETIFGVQGMHQDNSNSGEERLIPDAVTNDVGAMAMSHLHFDANNDLQFGLRYDHRSIMGETYGQAGDGDYIEALNRDFSSFNAAIGYKLNVSNSITTRFNIASGFRAPNLAELTSNGVHEGTNRYEIGNPDLENERNVQTDISVEYKNEHVEFFINGFLNNIGHFVYLEPTGEELEQSPVYRYQQRDAKLYGGEVGLHVHPHPIHWLHLESSFQTVHGKLDNDNFVPLIPANSITNTFRAEHDKELWGINNGYAYITLRSVFKQDNISAFESATDGYSLLSLGFGGNIRLFGQLMEIRVSGNNLLDRSYVSHLSRLKSDGMDNIGRNISVGLSLPL